MDNKRHWETIYTTKEATSVSWFQEHPRLSVELIERATAGKETKIIDVGGGASTLVDDLVEAGYRSITVLDISAEALRKARVRLGARAAHVTWIESDITKVDLPEAEYDVWHDRAVFHFLTGPEERAAYIAAVRRAVKPGGHVIVATFALDGPNRCSGLEVAQYSPSTLHETFGEGFELVDSATETHHTPSGAEQKFVYCYCRKG